MRALSLLGSLFVIAAAVVAAPAPNDKRWPLPPGFVQTYGENFVMDGEVFNYVGTNAYWLGLLTTQSDVDLTLQGIANAGYKVVRTWAFNAINQTELANATASGLTYYQLWDGPEYTLNEGPQGLQRLDYVVQQAETYGLKLILTFTNNWVGYGGSDLYIGHITPDNGTHSVFFTDPTIIASYQSYVTTIVNRYKSSPAVFSWELMNEARCSSDTFPASTYCDPYVLTAWYQSQSDFIRTLDPYHMINAGGEGQFYWAEPEYYWYNGQYVSDYNYNGGAGEDFEGVLKLSNIDFGGYHMYPETWYPEMESYANFSYMNWGVNWIEEHASAAQQIGKPIIIEEFGTVENGNKTAWYPTWVSTAISTGHAGIMPWQYGQLGLTEDGGNRLIKYTDMINNGASPNDGNAFYINETDIWEIFTSAAQLYSTTKDIPYR